MAKITGDVVFCLEKDVGGLLEEVTDDLATTGLFSLSSHHVSVYPEIKVGCPRVGQVDVVGVKGYLSVHLL